MNHILKKPPILKPKIETTLIKDNEILITKIKEYLDTTYGFKDEQIQNIIHVSKSSLKNTLIETEKAIKENDLKISKILFHRLKGSLNNIGLTESSEWARIIELEIETKNTLTNADQCLNKLKVLLEPFIS